jgi:hypothetical protein
VNPLLIRIVGMIARRLGPAAAATLLAAGRAWLANPENDDARAALAHQLRTLGGRAGGSAGRVAGGLARQVERRKVSVGSWEREVMSLRYEVAELASGPLRAAAFDAYLAQLAMGPLVVARAAQADTRRQVLLAFDNEARAIAREALGPDERRRALEEIDAGREGCYRTDSDTP